MNGVDSLAEFACFAKPEVLVVLKVASSSNPALTQFFSQILVSSSSLLVLCLLCPLFLFLPCLSLAERNDILIFSKPGLPISNQNSNLTSPNQNLCRAGIAEG
jgi:hypothetical protein